MQKTLRCPGCDAELTLTANDAARAQCPRCRCAFDLTRPAAVTALTADAPTPTRRHGAMPSLEDDLPADLRTLVRPDPLIGEWKASIAMFGLSCSIISYALQMFMNYVRVIAVQEHGLLPWRIDFTMLVHEAIYWPTLTFVLIWLYQASHNLKLLRSAALSHTPGLAVVSFFVPLLNLYRPYFIMQEIWRGSDPHAASNSLAWLDAPRSELIRFWWFFFLTGQIIVVLSPRRGETAAWTLSLSHLCMIIAGVLLITIIRAITIRQRQRYERLYAPC